MSANAKAPPAQLARGVERVRHHLYRLHQRLVPAPVALSELVVGAWVAQAVHAAAELGIADALADGPLAIDELARRVEADPDALARLLRALITRGVFRQRRDGRYDLTPLAETLRSDASASMAGGARFYGSPQHREHWSRLVDSVKTGRPSVPMLRGQEFFDYLAGEPDLARLFDEAMTSVSELAVGPIVAGYDFSGYSTIVDVGGGHGRLLAAILAATPAARGVLYDQPQVVADAPTMLRQHGIDDRVRIESGSFFESVPAGGDVYVLKLIIHDWPDEQAIKILRTVREAAGPGGTVLLVEQVIPTHDREFLGKWADLEMLLCLAARERTADEYRDLLARAGLRLTRVVQTAAPFSLVEAKPS
ncbi:MAG: methyltransferase [Mycobacterium sp.]|uniref:methyltransferase n=1 Tax=Mycobacterium sp. TaxID=1785 RepID=UPI003C59BBD7